MVRNLIIASALAATATVAWPSEASARDGDRYDRYYRDYYDDDDDDDRYRGRRHYRQRGYYNGYGGSRYYGYNQRRYRCRSKGTTGLIVGGAAGALLGREITRDRTTGAIIGGAAGALLGREVTRRNRC